MKRRKAVLIIAVVLILLLIPSVFVSAKLYLTRLEYSNITTNIETTQSKFESASILMLDDIKNKVVGTKIIDLDSDVIFNEIVAHNTDTGYKNKLESELEINGIVISTVSTELDIMTSKKRKVDVTYAMDIDFGGETRAFECAAVIYYSASDGVTIDNTEVESFRKTN